MKASRVGYPACSFCSGLAVAGGISTATCSSSKAYTATFVVAAKTSDISCYDEPKVRKEAAWALYCRRYVACRRLLSGNPNAVGTTFTFRHINSSRVFHRSTAARFRHHYGARQHHAPPRRRAHALLAPRRQRHVSEPVVGSGGLPERRPRCRSLGTARRQLATAHTLPSAHCEGVQKSERSADPLLWHMRPRQAPCNTFDLWAPVGVEARM